jgi:hypothetical protein
VTALSSTEAEYVALNEVIKEVLWLRELLKTMELPEYDHSSSTKIYEDNKAARLLASSDMIRGKSKHFSVRYHHTREAVADGMVEIVACPTARQVADMLTKNLDQHKFKYFRNQLLGINPFDPTTL